MSRGRLYFSHVCIPVGCMYACGLSVSLLDVCVFLRRLYIWVIIPTGLSCTMPGAHAPQTSIPSRPLSDKWNNATTNFIFRKMAPAKPETNEVSESIEGPVRDASAAGKRLQRIDLLGVPVQVYFRELIG